MVKYIRSKFSDGTMWDVPAYIIADYSARHYAITKLESQSTTYIELYNKRYIEIMASEVELMKVAKYVSWDVISKNIFKVTVDTPPADYEKEWPQLSQKWVVIVK
jgi:hypothetical protein